MANPSLNSTQLVDSIKRRAQIPQAQNTFQTNDFLAFANEEISIGILPDLMTFHQDFFLTSQTIPLQFGVSEYPIPTRAIGSKFENLVYIDQNGTMYKMTRIPTEDIVYHQNISAANTAYKFYIKGNSIVLIPSITGIANGSLEFFYYLRPNQLVDVSRVATIVNIDNVSSPGNTILTVNNLPANIADNTLIDFMQTSPNHKTYSFDVAIPSGGSNSANKTITLPASIIPPGLVIGDYIATAGESIYPQIPSELHSVLAQRVATRCLEALGDASGLASANQKLAEMVQKSGNVVDNRDEAAPLKIVNFGGLLRSGKFNRRSGGGI